jgi:hypothetical protein
MSAVLNGLCLGLALLRPVLRNLFPSKRQRKVGVRLGAKSHKIRLLVLVVTD